MSTRLPMYGDSPEAALPAPVEARSSAEIVVAYHERTKHHRHRYARSLGYLDWAMQPDPFRRYLGAPLVRLPLPAPGPDLPYASLFDAARESAALSVESVSLLFRYALSLTAWKKAGETTWALRANPSSGNLHPTEGYAVLPPIEGIHDHPAVHHYAPKEHGLERRADLDLALWSAIQAPLPAGAFLVGLSSVLWREAWKYGERAFRYCQHDVGHALGGFRVAAAALGWTLVLLDRTEGTSQLLGLDRDATDPGAEREHPDLLAVVAPGRVATDRGAWIDRALAAHGGPTRWSGTANVLSRERVAWPVIDEVAEATTAPITVREDADLARFPAVAELGAPLVGELSAEQVILGRRSAVRMDGTTTMPATTLYAMLARVTPTRDGGGAWDALPWSPRIHLGLFVHRVDGLVPGLYALVRDPTKLEALRQGMRQDFAWVRPAGCPPGLPLFLLESGDARALAATVSCGQDIAGDGAFSLGMIAEYLDALVSHGPAFYRHLFWEAGLVGQVLYLEAEAAGLRATGIGCYFDDAVHQVFGITSRDWQSLYHFTVGGPVDDTRLTTLPAYVTSA